MRTKLLMMALLPFFIVACGDGGKNASSNSAETVKIDSKLKNKKDANDAIAYTNSIIDFMNDYRTWMRTNDSKVVDTMKLVEDKRTGSVHSPLLPATFLKLKKIAAVPSSMGKSDKAFFKDGMDNFRKSFDSYMENSNKLIQYFRAQDYKDDDYKKGAEISAAIEKDRVAMFEQRDAIIAKIRAIGDKAEEALLSDSPIKDPILTMKAEMKSVSNLIGTFASFANGEIDVKALEAAYDKAAASIEKNKGQYKKILEKNKKEKGYAAFYEQCDKALGDFRICLRKAKEGKELNRDNFNSLNSQMNYIISKYNSF